MATHMPRKEIGRQWLATAIYQGHTYYLGYYATQEQAEERERDWKEHYCVDEDA
jgi:hypothetical protein